MSGAEPYIVIAQYQVCPGSGDIVAAALNEHGKATRDEPGCLVFAAHRSITNPHAFAIYEKYRSQADFTVHRQTPHYQKYIIEAVIPLLQVREVSFYQPLDDTA